MSKPAALLSQMPWNIGKSIVDFTDPISRISLRKCSRALRAIVDNSSVEYQSIVMELHEKSVVLHARSSDKERAVLIEYRSHLRGCEMVKGDRKKVLAGRNYTSMAVAVLESLIANRKTRIEQLAFVLGKAKRGCPAYFELDETELKRGLLRMMSRMQHRISVNWLRIDLTLCVGDLMTILSSLHPATLDGVTIKLFCHVKDLEELTESEHWKQLKRLCMRSFDYPLNKMAHFERLVLHDMPVSLEDVKLFLERAIQLGDNFDRFELINPRFVDRSAISAHLIEFLEVPPFFDIFNEIYRIKTKSEKNDLVLQMSSRSLCMSLKRKK